MKDSGYHRVDRVLGFFSSRPIGTPPLPSLSQASMSTSPLIPGGGHTLTGGGGGWEGPNSDEGADTVLLQVNMYFVVIAAVFSLW
jgi:hypothetical protein